MRHVCLLVLPLFLSFSNSLIGQQQVFLSPQFDIYAEDGVTRITSAGTFINGLGVIEACEGETFILRLTGFQREDFSSYPLLSGTLFNYTTDCDDNCDGNYSEASIQASYSGGSISPEMTNVNYSPGSMNAQCVSGTLDVTITPSSSGTISFSWTGSSTQFAGCENEFVRQFIVNGSANINVAQDISSPPVLTVSNTTVSPGETFSVVLETCSPGLRWEIHDACNYDNATNGQLLTGMCFNGEFPPVSVSFTAPDYTADLTFKGFYTRSLACPQRGVSETNPAFVRVVETPTQNACGDNDIASTESMLQDESLTQSRSDYHTYTTRKVICLENEGSCSVDDVFSHMMSDVSFQAPTIPDFTGDANDPVQYFDFGYLGYSQIQDNTPVANCSSIFLAGDEKRILANIGQTLFDPLGILFDLDLKDPVRIVVDNASKCVTNYTLPGHILHPGKIRRCVKKENNEDGCGGDIIVETVGTGYHFVGDNPLGEWMGNLNVEIGREAFQRLDVRMCEAYEN